jgi:hypothetical protein
VIVFGIGEITSLMNHWRSWLEFGLVDQEGGFWEAYRAWSPDGRVAWFIETNPNCTSLQRRSRTEMSTLSIVLTLGRSKLGIVYT